MQKLSIYLIFIFGIVSISYSQETYKNKPLPSKDFYSYLIDNALYNEAITHIRQTILNNSDSIQNDSLYAQLVCVFIKTSYFDSAIFYIKKIKNIEKSGMIESALFLGVVNKDTVFINSSLMKFKANIKPELYNEILLCNRMFQRIDISADSILNLDSELNDILKKYSGFTKKSAFCAGLLSTVVPGLGKHYLGYPRQAKSSFFINLVLAGLAVEFVVFNPILIPEIIAVTGFSTFYFGNILGSVLLTSKRYTDFYNSIDEDILYIFSNKFLDK